MGEEYVPKWATSALVPEMIKKVRDVMIDLAREGPTMIGAANKPEDLFSTPRHDRTKLFPSQIL